MRKYLSIAFALLAIGLACLHEGRSQILPLLGAGKGAAGFAASCTESSNFIARTSGQDDSHKSAYDGVICGLVTDSVFAKLDALYMLRGADATVILLNLIQNAFNLTKVGAITFAANAGVTGDGSTGYYTTGMQPSTAGGQYQQNAASNGFCDTTAIDDTTVALAAFDNVAFSEIVHAGGNTLGYMNNATGAQAVGDAGTGLWHASRTSSTLVTLYKNATSKATDATVTIQNLAKPFFVLARNNNNTPDLFSSRQVTMAVIGGSLTSTDISNFRTRISTYMSAIGSAAC